METYYLVDFENVGSSGLTNCSGLTETGHIILFYTNNANKIDLNFINEHGGAELKTIRVPAKSQSIDMHIVSFMGFLIGKNKGKNIRIIVVSKDNMQHVDISRLYPCGEGAGYAGGITSSALDGINAAEQIHSLLL